ncbi:oxidoreductase [Ohtaekwangia koreensis]|uniref:Short-chain dehydrogenase n=1 Tax=Ohtaekwangia koreensis TaxID=688867 RepID=A0A1T5M783_9BACT|nr:oxidoreductase [Ohtaekwangia koreensis]SKC84112.1 Short-chain dehydrogenase [Ohtaekwangia koreensis]
MKTKKVWFVTGASKGLGLSIVKKLLEQGYQVAATSRKVEDLNNAVGTRNGNFLPIAVDLSSEVSVGNAIDQTVNRFGRVDVIVNNAGYGLAGGIEELSDQEVRGNFEINVFGLLNVIRKAMPYLRGQRSGHIFNISSIGGFTGAFPGWGIYCATKFAVSGLTESLAEEAKAFGIDVTVVEPGYFRTNFLAASSMAVPAHQIDEYKNVRESQSLHQNTLNGNQQGDPDKAADALIAIAKEKNPPLHLLLGEDAYTMALQKMATLQQEIETWKNITVSTGFAKEGAQSYIGMWVTKDGHIRQELLPGGRYDEARGTKKSAYTGSYTIDGDHIEYIDDTGFTASGDFREGVLHHGGYLFYKEEAVK